MKYLFLLTLILYVASLSAQSLQLHYDIRHTIDPDHADQNFPTVYFEYFKNSDTGKVASHLGPFQLKMQADFNGIRANISQMYMQVFQQFRFWKPKFYINLQYSGGLGVTDPRQYSYYIVNTYSAGLSAPFRIGNAYLSSELDYRLTGFKYASHDLAYTLYFWKGLWKYRAEFSGDFTIWTQNRDHGDDLTAGMKGKQVLFFGEPQLWFNINTRFAAGSKVNIYYHILQNDNTIQVYPTAAVRVKL